MKPVKMGILIAIVVLFGFGLAIQEVSLENQPAFEKKDGQTEICNRIDKAYAARQFELVRDLAKLCCCRKSTGNMQADTSSQVNLPDNNTLAVESHNSKFLPAPDIQLVSSNPVKNSEIAYNVPTKDILKILNSGSDQLITHINDNSFPLDGILVAYNPLKKESILQYFARLQQIPMMQALLDQGADINYGAGSSLGTPLHVAVYTLNKKVVKFLLSHGADANATDESGTTPLHIIASLAASPEAFSITQLLIDYGAQVNQKNSDNLSPSDMVLKSRLTIPVIQLLKEQSQAYVEQSPKETTVQVLPITRKQTEEEESASYPSLITNTQ